MSQRTHLLNKKIVTHHPVIYPLEGKKLSNRQLLKRK